MNKKLFSTLSKAKVANTVNNAGGSAYSLSAEQGLAKFAVTGTFGNTYYVSDEDQLKQVIELLPKVTPEFVAKLAVYSRKSAHMKDMPAVLLAALASRDVQLCKRVFPLVVDNARMLRGFVKMVRSGQFGRKSLGTAVKKLVQNWISSRKAEQLFRQSIGNDPSLLDIIKMTHPKLDGEQAGLVAYLLGKPLKEGQTLPSIVQDFEKFKANPDSYPIPNLPHEFLTALPLNTATWTQIFRTGGWHFVRMNLNTAQRHGVLKDESMVDFIADRLKNEDEIATARVFPYQVLAAYLNAGDDVPQPIKSALGKAVDAAIKNIPVFTGNVVVAVDVSGSMKSPITGSRGTATSKVTCVDVASLFASAILRKNPKTKVIAFDTSVHIPKLDAEDTVFTNSTKLATYGGGGTDCSLAGSHIVENRIPVDLLILISDNESWAGMNGRYGSTGLADYWLKIKSRNPNAKLVNLDLTPNQSTQTDTDRNDVLLVGGFSDKVFDVVKVFQDTTGADAFVKTIQDVSLAGV